MAKLESSQEDFKYDAQEFWSQKLAAGPHSWRDESLVLSDWLAKTIPIQSVSQWQEPRQ